MSPRADCKSTPRITSAGCYTGARVTGRRPRGQRATAGHYIGARDDVPKCRSSADVMSMNAASVPMHSISESSLHYTAMLGPLARAT